MSLRDFLKVDITFDEEYSREFEISRVLYNNPEKTCLFNRVRGSRFRVVGNLVTSRERFCSAMNTTKENFIARVMHALKNPVEPVVVEEAACHELSLKNLHELPILKHFEKDAGYYITSSVVFAQDEEFGRNASFHRMLLLDERHLVIRLVERHLYSFYRKKAERNEPLDIAIAIGLHPAVLFSAAYSFQEFRDELTLAGALADKPVEVVNGKKVGVSYPAEAEIVIEARILPDEYADEGPFTDITGTYDKVRKQPVVEVLGIYARRDAIYHALLPGGIEHRLLMGMPREPAIFSEVSKVADVRNVVLTPGGCNWLHGVVAIKKKSERDAELAIKAAFSGHKSMKHVVIVDEDIDIFNTEEVEFAIATRFQGDRDIYVFKGERGSSLDPSAGKTGLTTKVGIDATKPLGEEEAYERAKIPEVEG